MLGGALLAMNLKDLDQREMVDYVYAEVRIEVKMRWKRVRNALIIESRLRKKSGMPSNKPPAKLPPLGDAPPDVPEW